MQILHNDVGRSVEEASRLLDAFQYVEEHGVVCPANWKPGEATMIAHPDKSMEYFNSAAAAAEEDEEDDFGATLTPVGSAEEYRAAVGQEGAVVVRPWLALGLYQSMWRHGCPVQLELSPSAARVSLWCHFELRQM